MENRQQQHNGQGNGFLWGVIVGVLVTLLFTTKRGRAIFKEVLDHGAEKFAHLEKLMRESEEAMQEFAEEDETDDYIPVAEAEPVKDVVEAIKAEQSAVPAKEETLKKQATEKEEKPKPTTKVKEENAEEKAPKSPQGKRWFRGLRKKS